MVYYDKGSESPRRIYRPLQRSIPTSVAGLDDAKARYISEVAAEHPRFTPEEVLAEIRHGRRQDDITVAMVRYVLAQ